MATHPPEKPAKVMEFHIGQRKVGEIGKNQGKSGLSVVATAVAVVAKNT